MHFLTLASVVLTAAAGASAIVIPRSHVHHARVEKPDTYYEGYLEPYVTYHTRYLAIDCDQKHGTSYFDRCCHPMLATETLEKNRDADCNPANIASSAISSAASTTVASVTVSSAAPSASATQVLSSSGDDDDDSDCEDEEPTSTASSAAPTSTSDDDDDEDCDDEGDEPSSSAAPASTHVATPSSTHVASSTHVTSSAHPTTPASTHVATTSSTHSTKAATSTHTISKPAATSSSGGSDGAITGGVATFFFQGGQAGACGTVHADSDLVAALQTERYGDLGAKSKNCGKQLKITNNKNGKSVVVTVADACPTCINANSVDLSKGAFDKIATEEEGEVPITWEFV